MGAQLLRDCYPAVVVVMLPDGRLVSDQKSFFFFLHTCRLFQEREVESTPVDLSPLKKAALIWGSKNVSAEVERVSSPVHQKLAGGSNKIYV